MKNRFTKKLLSDLRVELMDEFDRNFERKAFFSKPWPARKHGHKGTVLNVKEVWIKRCVFDVMYTRNYILSEGFKIQWD